MQPESVAFLSRLQERSEANRPSGPAILAGCERSDGAVIVIYRENGSTDDPGALILGRIYDLRSYAAQFSPSWTISDLADVAYDDDLCDPSGPGSPLPVRWADDLVPEPERVRWLLSHRQLEAIESVEVE